MKIGVISRGSPDYLIDIITDGLIRTMGRENLSLDYNVRGGWGGQYAILLQGVQGPEPFDIHDAEMLIGSVRSLPEIEVWMKRTGKKKVALIDGEDGPDIRTPWETKVPIYFKREYLRGKSYAPSIHSLPFGAIPEALPNVCEITSSVFFHAHGSSPIRTEISETITNLGYYLPSKRTEKAEYNKKLASSLVGISARGGGWDTYRYWEVPYMGTALLSQRLEIVIPDDFEEGMEAEYFSTVSEMKEKLERMLSQPEKTAMMGHLGRAKCLKHHLSIHRAKTVLEALA